MKHLPVHPTLSDADRSWLANTFAANRAKFAGWSMEEPTAEEKAAADAKTAADAATKAAADADAAKKAAEGPGYPADTPVAEMTTEQQAAYHRAQSRKHEDRAKGWSTAFPGKTAAEIKAIVDAAETSRRNTLTVDDKALEDAEKKGRSAALADLGPKAVKASFDLLLPGDMPAADKAELIDTLDLSKFLTDDNEVDTAKVRAHAARISPDKGQGNGHDFGQGRRGGSAPAGGVAAVMAERRAAREANQK